MNRKTVRRGLFYELALKYGACILAAILYLHDAEIELVMTVNKDECRITASTG